MAIEYNVVIYDFPGVDRTPIRPQHLAAIPSIVNKGKVLSAGGLFEDESRTKLIGSAFHLLAENRQEVIEFLKQDIYYTLGIWDINNVLINPIGIASRSPKVLPGVNEEVYKS